MSRTERLQPIVQHAINKEQTALQEVSQAQARLMDEKSKHARLLEFRREYQNKAAQGEQVCSAHQLQEFTRFLYQLETTIMQQRSLIQQRQVELDQRREAWSLKRKDSKVMHNAVDKMQHQELIENDRSEQKELDDLVQQKGHRNLKS